MRQGEGHSHQMDKRNTGGRGRGYDETRRGGRGKVSQEEDKQVEKVQQGEDGGGGVGERGEVLQEIDKR